MAKTAAELMTELARNSEHSKNSRAAEDRRKALHRELQEDEFQLVQGLVALGIEVNSVWDLVNSNGDYSAGVPTLVQHLSVPHHPRILEGIVRALSVPFASPLAVSPLINLFRSITDDSELKWLVGAAIAESAHSDSREDIVALIQNEKHGRSREFLPLGLACCPAPVVRSFLEPLVDHNIMGESAAKALSLIK